MLWTIAASLGSLWLVGLVMNVGGGLIHLLLAVAFVLALVRLAQGETQQPI